MWAVRGTGFVIGFSAFVYSFFMDRAINVDELGLYNPVYVFLHYGKMAYPAYGPGYFREMVVHPPVHYLILALLTKAGLGPIHAAGVPVFVFTIVSLMLIARGRFPETVKLGLMWGLFSGAFLWGPAYTVRPDLHLAVAWFAGLVALETARLDDWNTGRLFLGSLLLVYASSLHYFGAIAFSGVAVYSAWAIKELRWPAARPRVVGMILGGCLFGIPYLTLFIIPHWAGIWSMVHGVQGTLGLRDALHTHYSAYAYWQRELQGTWRVRPTLALSILPGLKLGIPLWFIGSLALFAHPSTRVMALAAVPQALFVMLYSQGKSAGYYIPEFILYLSGILVILIDGIMLCAAALRQTRRRELVVGTEAFVVAAAMMVNVPATLGSRWAFTVHLVDMQVARAAGRRILGGNGLVGTTSVDAWYITGAAHLYLMRGDLLYPRDLSAVKLPRYLSRFDALAEDNTGGSGLTWNQERVTLTSLYSDRVLNLKGFYFGRWARVYGESLPAYILLETGPTRIVVGFLYNANAVYRFEKDANGQTIFVAVTCLRNRLRYGAPRFLDFFTTQDAREPLFFATFDLPGSSNARAGERVIAAFVMDRREYSGRRENLVRGCTIRDEIAGHLVTQDVKHFPGILQDDRAIRFYETYPGAVQGAKGIKVGPDGR